MAQNINLKNVTTQRGGRKKAYMASKFLIGLAPEPKLQIYGSI